MTDLDIATEQDPHRANALGTSGEGACCLGLRAHSVLAAFGCPLLVLANCVCSSLPFPVQHYCPYRAVRSRLFFPVAFNCREN